MAFRNLTDHQTYTQAHWKTYSTADGLAALRVEHIAQDAEGQLWLATFNGGVSCFDGAGFRTFTRADGLCDDHVLALHLDGAGRMWFGTLGGVCWREGGVFHLLDQSQGAPASAIWISADSQGRVWLGGQGFMGYFDGTRFHNLYDQLNLCLSVPYNHGWGIVEDAGGDIWICHGGGLARYDGRRFYRCGQGEGLAADLLGPFAATHSPQYGLWVGAHSRIWRLDGQSFQSVAVEFSGFIRKMRTDRQGRIWFCLSGGGALCYDGEAFHRFTTRNGLPFNVVSDVFEDREGLIWFATWGGGVACYDPHSLQFFAHHDQSEGIEARTLSADRQGRVWAGFATFQTHRRERVACYDGDGFAVQGDGLMACQARDDLWIGGKKGLARFDGGALRQSEEFAGSRITALATAGDEGLWVGHVDCDADGDYWRISRYCPITRSSLQIGQGRSMDGYRVCALVSIADGSLWFGLASWAGTAAGKGIGRWHPQEGLSWYTTADGLVDDRVNDLAADDCGNLWIATYAGVSRFDGEGFENFTVAEGLPHNQVWCVCVDREGGLWLGTDGGVARYNGRFFQTLHLPRVAPALQILQDLEGVMWLATHTGVVRYCPMSFAPQVTVEQILAGRTYRPGGPIEVPTSVGQLVFEYRGASFRTAAQDMVFRYRLSGREEDWQRATRANKAYYRDLPPGEYVFEVQAFDRDLNASELVRVPVVVVADPRQDRIEALEEALRHPAGGQLMGHSESLRGVLEQVDAVAATDMPVLILGETGTGKGLVADAIHRQSQRRHGPFIQVNCGAIPLGLVESELFGHEKGAFTGAVARKIGRFELAAGGTLFLDEIGDLALEAQRALLQVLQDRTFQRVGGAVTIRADVRVVAATNRDLDQAIVDRTFREDLFYRLKGFALRLPPLRQRRDDIPLLARHFAVQYAQHLDRPVPQIVPAALAYLQAYAWPGNVRELEYMVQRALLVSRNGAIEVEELASGLSQAPVHGRGELVGLAEFERQVADQERVYLEQALEAVDWRIAGDNGAARLLGVHPEKLRSRMRKYNLQRDDSGG